MYQIAKLISVFFNAISVFAIWIIKGCRTPLKEEFSERNKLRNGAVTLCIVCTLLALILYINNQVFE